METTSEAKWSGRLRESPGKRREPTCLDTANHEMLPHFLEPSHPQMQKMMGAPFLALILREKWGFRVRITNAAAPVFEVEVFEGW